MTEKPITGEALERLVDEIIAGKRRKRKPRPRRMLAPDIIRAAKDLAAKRGTHHE